MSDADSAARPADTHRDEGVLHLAYAEASIMLIECLFQALIARGVLQPTDVLGALEDVISTKRTQVEQGEHADIARLAAGVLSTMMNSLQAGFPRGPARSEPERTLD